MEQQEYHPHNNNTRNKGHGQGRRGIQHTVDFSLGRKENEKARCVLVRQIHKKIRISDDVSGGSACDVTYSYHKNRPKTNNSYS